MKVLQVCAFGAPNPGNFIASLTALERELKAKGAETVYAFAETARDKEWCRELCRTHKVYFLPVAKARILPRTYAIFRRIYREEQVDIVHSHFELYDIPATVTAPRGTKVFWHLHDPLPDKLSGLRGILTRIQYGIVGKRAELLSVSEHYRKQVVGLGFPDRQSKTILNGISLERIQPVPRDGRERRYTFLTFCWDYFRKGTDLILDACDRLYEEGYQFKILLNGNEQTWPYVKEHYQDKIPPYIECGGPVENVNDLYADTASFIQASRRETFSYAVCEAAYAGLPVISSDIPGLEWAHELPTVLFFEKEDIAGLYACMKKIIAGDRWPEEEIRSSRDTIEDEFSLRAWCGNILKVYSPYLRS